VTWSTNGNVLTWTWTVGDGGSSDGDGYGDGVARDYADGYGDGYGGEGGGYGDGYGYGDGGDGDGDGYGSTESLSFPLVDEMVDVNLRACAAVARRWQLQRRGLSQRQLRPGQQRQVADVDKCAKENK